MENNKLSRVAKKLSKLVKGEEISDMYPKYMDLISKNKSYFDIFNNQDKIKILFYIYSWKKVGSDKLAEDLIDKFSFIGFITTENENSVETCDDCGGDGNQNCDECSGTSKVTCDACDGNGQVECSDCEGSRILDGEKCDQCNGRGTEDCDDCDGSGELDCGWCGGDGVLNCDLCGGDGNVESDDKVDYKKYEILTWNPKLSKIAKDLLELETPFLEENVFWEKYGDSILLLNLDYESESLEELDSEMVYFFYESDLPQSINIVNSKFRFSDLPHMYFQ